MRLLELFSGTHSIGKVAKKRNIEVISLDRDLPADIQEDIMEWDYTIYPKNHFDIITASPVCLWWSNLRVSNINRRLKHINYQVFTREMLENDIKKYGEPMVDKVFEILEYFNPKYFWIENPYTSRMKHYISDLIPYYVVDYCQYGFDYQKPTIFWTNIEGFEPKRCNKKDCKKTIFYNNQYYHIKNNGSQSRKKQNEYLKSINKNIKIKHSNDKYERYRIPEKLISEFLDLCK